MLNHYIPRWYLRAWTRQDGKLVRYTSRDGKIEMLPRNLKQVGAKKDLYTMHSQPDDLKHKLETAFFSPLDNLACKVVRKIMSRPAGGISAKEAHQLAIFFATLLVRGPIEIGDAREALGKIMTDLILENADSVLVFKGERPDDPIAYIQKHAPQFLNDLALRILPDVLVSNSVVDAFRSMFWSVREFDDFSPGLVTGDQPLVILPAEGNFSLDEKIERSAIYVPLSPRLALLGSKTEESIGEIARVSDRVLGESLNKQIACNAEQFIYAHNREHMKLAEGFLSLSRPTQILPFSQRQRGPYEPVR